ncbi:MAG: D-alanine--D-alanine ligase [Clostridioides sp.]|jgi:D-alanine-D-alanine ligase|nr:D-alanine--D-alanine ligase [Clostridioides sp.]
MKVAVIMGGISTERDISLMSGTEVYNYLDKDKYEVVKVVIDEKKDVFTKIPEDTDFALLALHGMFGEDGTIQHALEILDIPYSGCDPLCSGMLMNKNVTKKMLRDSGLPTAPWTVTKSIEEIDYDCIEEIGYPVFVKPNCGGSSVATFLVKNREDIEAAVRAGLEVDEFVMIEKYVKGVEHTSFVLDGEVFPTISITYQSEFFDREVKYAENGAVEEVVYLEEELENKVNEISEQIWKIFNCKGYIRADYIISGNDVNVLEINTLPGMTRTSLIPKSAAARGMSYSDLLDKLIESSLNN